MFIQNCLITLIYREKLKIFYTIKKYKNVIATREIESFPSLRYNRVVSKIPRTSG